MVTEIVRWCSPCYEDDIKAEGHAVTVVLDGGKSMSVDLCDRHDKELIEPLRVLLSEYGMRVELPPSMTCAECGAQLKNADSLAKHMRRKHDKSVDSTKPVVDESALPYQCPESDCSRGFATAVGLGSHRARVHGYVSPTRHKRDAKKAKSKT